MPARLFGSGSERPVVVAYGRGSQLSADLTPLPLWPGVQRALLLAFAPLPRALHWLRLSVMFFTSRACGTLLTSGVSLSPFTAWRTRSGWPHVDQPWSETHWDAAGFPLPPPVCSYDATRNACDGVARLAPTWLNGPLVALSAICSASHSAGTVGGEAFQSRERFSVRGGSSSSLFDQHVLFRARFMSTFHLCPTKLGGVQYCTVHK